MKLYSGIITGSLTVNGNMSVSNSLTASNALVTGSININGATTNNVIAVTVASSTASLDFSKGSFFTVTLPASATTHISASNSKPGISTVVVISTDTANAVTFNSAIKQPSSSLYQPSPSGSTDILSFIAVDNTKIYSVSLQKMV